MIALLSIPTASYCSIKYLVLTYFLCQQDHKLNENGITQITSFVYYDRVIYLSIANNDSLLASKRIGQGRNIYVTF